MNDRYKLVGTTPVPCDDLMEWGKSMSGERHVGEDTFGDVRVSTVFLGLDHQYGNGPPLLFETMIFGGEHDLWQDRYSTWEEAEQGHARAVQMVKGQPGETL